MTGRLYKVTAADGSALIGNGRWHLPRGSQPGKWMPVISDVVPCEAGYHVTSAHDLFDHVRGRDPVVWEVEVRGTVVDAGNKLVASEARLIRLTPLEGSMAWRLLVSDFAAHVHQHFDAVCPGDSRVRDAIRVARAHAVGTVSDADLSAAWDAARAAASAATWAAARDYSMAATRGAASAAARGAASAAAWAASIAATGAAASDASIAASGAASAAAWDAAEDAAWDAAWGAAWDAAGAAEREWQARLIRDVLAGRREPGRVRITMARKEAS